MRRVGAIALLVFTAALLQTALLPHLAIAGFRADLLLLATVAFAFHDGPLAGVYVGFVSGLLADLLVSTAPVGLYALILLVVGYLVGVVRPYLAPRSASAPLAIAAAGALVATGGYGLVARALGAERFSMPLIARSTLVVAVYSMLLAPLVFWVVGHVSETFPEERGGGAGGIHR